MSLKRLVRIMEDCFWKGKIHNNHLVTERILTG